MSAKECAGWVFVDPDLWVECGVVAEDFLWEVRGEGFVQLFSKGWGIRLEPVYDRSIG